MARNNTSLNPNAGTSRKGFTLVEILAAIAVMGVATFIIISLFSTSMSVSETNRSRKVAAALAEERLAAILDSPQAYQWPDLESLAPGKMVQFTPLGPENTACTPPETMPLDTRMYNRETNFYDRFSWEGYVRAPEDPTETGYLELTVVVRWTWAGRNDLFALTSAVPKTALEELI